MLDRCRWTVVVGPWSLDRGRWTVVVGPWLLDRGRWTVVVGPWSLHHGCCTVVVGPWSLNRGRCTVVVRPWSLHRGRCTVVVVGPWYAKTNNDGCRNHINSGESRSLQCAWAANQGRLSSKQLPVNERMPSTSPQTPPIARPWPKPDATKTQKATRTHHNQRTSGIKPPGAGPFMRRRTTTNPRTYQGTVNNRRLRGT
jgi:hypothetical protein